jgi:exodeoxyribonuclease III
MGVKKHDNEGRIIAAEFDKFILVSVYVPNAGDGCRRLDYRVGEFDKDFHDYLKKLETTTKKPVILTGDLNVAHEEIDIFDPRGRENCACFTPEERGSFGNLLKQNDFIDSFRHLYPDTKKFSFFSFRRPRWRNEGWRLDYFITSA